MKVLLFLANGFETMEASVFADIMGWSGARKCGKQGRLWASEKAGNYPRALMTFTEH